MQKERYKKFLLTIRSSPLSNYRSTKRKCLIKTRLTFSILSEQVSPVKKSNRLVCILTSRELSSVDVTGAGGEWQDLQILKQAAFEQLLLTEQSRVELLPVFLSRNRLGSVCTSASGSRNEQENARGNRGRADRISAGKKVRAHITVASQSSWIKTEELYYNYTIMELP